MQAGNYLIFNRSIILSNWFDCSKFETYVKIHSSTIIIKVN